MYNSKIAKFAIRAILCYKKLAVVDGRENGRGKWRKRSRPRDFRGAASLNFSSLEKSVSFWASSSPIMSDAENGAHFTDHDSQQVTLSPDDLDVELHRRQTKGSDFGHESVNPASEALSYDGPAPRLAQKSFSTWPVAIWFIMSSEFCERYDSPGFSLGCCPLVDLPLDLTQSLLTHVDPGVI